MAEGHQVKRPVTPVNDADRHAEARERQARKRRYGMRISGTSVRLLGRLTRQAGAPKRRGRKGRAGPSSC